MKKLAEILDELEKAIPFQHKHNHAISSANIGWHIEHTLLTLNKIIHVLSKSDPAGYKFTFNIGRMLIFTLNRIPRGRGKAPKVVQPEDFTSTSLEAHIELTRKSLLKLNSLKHKHYFEHPYFGNLNLKATIKFLLIHSKHHLGIIHDIQHSIK